jgi:hypothetical protein
MRIAGVLLLVACILAFAPACVAARGESDTLLGIAYTLAAPALGLLTYGLLDGDSYDSSYGDHSLLSGFSWVRGEIEADGGSAKAGGVAWHIMRSISHSYDEDDRLFGLVAHGNELIAEFLISLPLDPSLEQRDALNASFAATICHYDPVSFGANLLLLELEDGVLP